MQSESSFHRRLYSFGFAADTQWVNVLINSLQVFLYTVPIKRRVLSFGTVVLYLIMFMLFPDELYLSLYGDIRESANHELTAFAAKLLHEELCFNKISLSASDCHAISLILKKVAKPICLFFSQCNLDDHSFAYIFSAIKKMPGSVS